MREWRIVHLWPAAKVIAKAGIGRVLVIGTLGVIVGHHRLHGAKCRFSTVFSTDHRVTANYDFFRFHLASAAFRATADL